jgi:4'-phosphopantetheinyl transferase
MLHPEAARERAWIEARRIVPLADDEVQVWRVRVDLDGRDPVVAAAIAAVVTPDDRERAARFRFEADRQRYLHGRLLVRTFLGHHAGLPPRTVAFVNGAFGKPELQLPESPARAGVLRFNLSHSGDWVLFALARDREIGVDVEQHRTMSDAMDLARRFFSPPEVAALDVLDPSLRHDAFFRVWSRKEAIIKASGHGLSAGLDRFAVSADPPDGADASEGSRRGGQVGFRGLDGDPVWERWMIHALEMPSGYAAAVAFDRGNVTVTCFEWTPSSPPEP